MAFNNRINGQPLPCPRMFRISAVIFALVFVQTIPEPVVSVEVTASIATPSLGTSVLLSCRIFKPNGYPVEWKRSNAQSGTTTIASTHMLRDCSNNGWFVKDRTYYKWSTCDMAKTGVAHQDFNLTIIKTRHEDTGHWHCEEMNAGIKSIRIDVITLPDLASKLSVRFSTAVPATDVEVHWSETPGYPANFDNYQVTISPSPGSGNIAPGSTVKGDTKKPMVTFSGMTPGQQYTVTVRTKKGNDLGNPTSITFHNKPNPLEGSKNIRVIDIKATTANVQWDAPVGMLTHYFISVSPAPAVADPSKTTGKTTNLKNMKGDTTYTVTIRTMAGDTEGNPVSTTLKTKAEPLGNPSTVTISSITTKGAKVSWTAVPGASQYVISVKPTDGGARAKPDVVTATIRATNLESLTPGIQYTVTVKAKSASQESAGTSKAFTTKPVAVNVFTITVTSVTATSGLVAWAAVTTGTFVNYALIVTPMTGGATVVPATVPKGGTLSASMKNLTPGTMYTIIIQTRASTDTMWSDQSKLRFTTLPAAVTESSIQITAITTNSAIMSWTGVTIGIFKTYEISIRPTAGGAKADPASVPKGTHTTTLRFLVPGTHYVVSIRTRDGGLMSVSVLRTFRTKPSNVNASSIRLIDVGTHAATVTWEKVVGMATEYWLSIVPAEAVITPNTVPASTDPLKAALTKLYPGRVYNVSVTAVSEKVQSDPSMRQYSSKPLPVTGLTLITPKDNQMTISWVAGVGGVQSAYRVRYRPIFANPISPWTKVLVRHPLLKTDIGILPGEKYEVEVAADSGHVLSDPTTRTMVTAPLPPSSATVLSSTPTSTSMSVSWTPPSIFFTASYFTTYVVRYKKKGTWDWKTILVTNTIFKKEIKQVEAGVVYLVEVLTETKEGKRSTTGAEATREIKLPAVDASSINYAVPIEWPIVINLSWGPVTGAFKTYDVTFYPKRGNEKADPSSIPKGGSTQCVLRELVPDIEYVIIIRTNDGTRQSEGAVVKIWTVPPPDLDELDASRYYSVASARGVIGEEPVEDYMEGSFVIDL